MFPFIKKNESACFPQLKKNRTPCSRAREKQKRRDCNVTARAAAETGGGSPYKVQYFCSGQGAQGGIYMEFERGRRYDSGRRRYSFEVCSSYSLSFPQLLPQLLLCILGAPRLGLHVSYTAAAPRIAR